MTYRVRFEAYALTFHVDDNAEMIRIFDLIWIG